MPGIRRSEHGRGAYGHHCRLRFGEIPVEWRVIETVSARKSASLADTARMDVREKPGGQRTRKAFTRRVEEEVFKGKHQKSAFATKPRRGRPRSKLVAQISKSAVSQVSQAACQ